jgi:hypothetical protein
MQKAFSNYIILLLVLCSTASIEAQWRQTMKWKAVIATGISYPFTDGFVQGSFAQPVNFPTVNLGIQRMFKQEYGARLDYGFNRFASAKESAEFKINYTRFNLQFVYDPTQLLRFLPKRTAIALHGGPGISFAKPLGGIVDRNQTFANLLGGFELHYAINQRLNVFGDFSYIWGLTSLDDYEPPLSGLGAFNGSLFTVTVGLSISLSGCQYCD